MKILAFVFVSLIPWQFAIAASKHTASENVYSVSSVKFSPNGNDLAYTLCVDSMELSGPKSERCDLFISSKGGWQSGLPSAFIAAQAETFAWSPDSKRLAFLHKCGSRECISVTDGSKMEDFGAAAGDVLEWLTPDSLIIAEAAIQPRDDSAISSSSDGGLFVVHGDEERTHSLNAKDVSLILLTVSTDKRKVIDKNVPMFRGRPFVAAAPNGQAVAYTVARRQTDESLITVDIMLWQRGSKPQIIARNVTQQGLNGELIWSPASTKIAWCGGADERVGRADKVTVFDLAHHTLVTSKFSSSIKPCPEWRLYAEDLPDLVWLNEDYILVSADDYPRRIAIDRRPNTIYQLSLKNWRVEKLYRGARDEEDYILASVGNSSDGTKSIFVLMRPDDGGPPSLMKWTRDGGMKALVAEIPGGITKMLFASPESHDEFVHVDQVANSTPSLIINDFASSKTYDIHLVPSSDPNRSIAWLRYSIGNQQRAAALIAPLKIKQNSRLMVVVYPTLRSSDLLALADSWPFPGLSYWLKRGDLVLYPDMLVRSGHARTDIVDDVKYAMQGLAYWEQRKGIRTCGSYVFGQSAGALAVYDLITSKIKLDGAIATDGFSNWEAYFGDASGESSNMMPYGGPIAEYSSIGPTGTPWTNPEGYRSASPYYDFGKVSVPLLLGHGTKDPLDSYHSEAAFISLESLGKDVSLALADGGGHGPGTWNAEQQKAFLQLVNQFISGHTPKGCRSHAGN